MKKLVLSTLALTLFLSACGGKSTKKRSLDNTLFKYASLVRWSDFNNAAHYLKPDDETIQPTRFELEKLKQFKVSSYTESPIRPGKSDEIILQNVDIQLYNIHNNRTKTIIDQQIWEFNSDLKQWFLTSGLPKL